jgi:hypothetical protein
MRSISRVVGVSINTVAKLFAEAGEAGIDFHGENVRGLNCKRIECAEVWCFVYAKEKNVPEDVPTFAGDCWTWTSVCADSKLICNSFIGGRDADYAKLFMDDLGARPNHRVQMTTDGHVSTSYAERHPHDENAHAPLHKADKCLFEKV